MNDRGDGTRPDAQASPDLEVFRLRDQDHTDLFGIFLGVHALPGSILLLHTTVGCKFKTQQHLVHHDWLRESHNDRLWTGVDDARLIAGSGDRLVEFATTWYERRRPSLFVVATSTAVELSAFDVEEAVARLRRVLPCPVLLLPAPGYAGSLWGGYRRVIEAAAGLADWSRPGDPGATVVAGYLMDRYEMDHAANLQELRRLLGLLGLRVPAVLLGGDDVEKVQGAGEAGSVVLLPYGHALADGLRAGTGRPVVPAGLPMGVRGTDRFLEAVAAGLGRDPAAARQAARRERERIATRVEVAARRLRGAGAAVFLDTPLAAAVCGFLQELGVEVRLAALTDGEEASGTRFGQALSLAGGDPGAVGRVLVDPSRDAAAQALFRFRAAEPFPLVVGTAAQRGALKGHRSLAAQATPVVEMGYPASTKHFLYPTPWLGYAGTLALAQRFLDAALQELTC